MTAQPAQTQLAFISQGKLFVLHGGGDIRPVESPFAQEHLERQEKDQENSAWKGKGGGEGPFGAGMVWGRQMGGRGVKPAAVVEIGPGIRPNEILYVLQLSRSKGLFRQDLASGEERRIFHKEHFEPLGLAADPRSGEVIISARDQEGLSDLELYDRDEKHQATLTGGDSQDAQPFQDPARPGVVWFQSSGAGRDAQRNLVAFGPAHLNRLDRTNGRLETVVERADKDCLAPQVDAAGNLYFLRRPWRAPGQVPLAGSLLDLLLFPVRLVRAIFGFLDVFSRLFGDKPLRAAGGPLPPGMTEGRVWLHGRMIDVAQAAKRGGIGGGPGLVGRDWELVRRSADGQEQVLERGVATFAVSPAGDVIVSDGFLISRIHPTRDVLHRGSLITRLCLVPGTVSAT